jgi:hypothetical protein
MEHELTGPFPLSSLYLGLTISVTYSVWMLAFLRTVIARLLKPHICLHLPPGSLQGTKTRNIERLFNVNLRPLCQTRGYPNDPNIPPPVSQVGFLPSGRKRSRTALRLPSVRNNFVPLLNLADDSLTEANLPGDQPGMVRFA